MKGQNSLMQDDVQAQRGTEEDVKAIEGIVREVEAGWNSGDGGRFAAPFGEEADYVIVNGMFIKGKGAIAGGHQAIFDTIYIGSRNDFELEGLRFLTRDVAVARVRAHLKFAQGGVEKEGHARSTWVLVKDGGEWRVEAFHNTPIVG